MQLSETTIEILKNFATLNEGIVLNEGSLLVTVGGKDIFARAVVPDVFPKRCAIPNIRKVLGVVSLMDSSDLQFEDNQLVIQNDRQVVRITYADFDAILTPKSDDLKVPFSEVTFSVSAADLSKTISGSAVLGLPEISITGDGQNINLRAINIKDKTADSFSTIVGQSDKQFKMVYKVERLNKLLARDYEVTLSKYGITRFSHTDVTYMVAAEPTASDPGAL